MPRCILPSQQSCKVHKVESNAKENTVFFCIAETKYLRRSYLLYYDAFYYGAFDDTLYYCFTPAFRLPH